MTDFHARIAAVFSLLFALGAVTEAFAQGTPTQASQHYSLPWQLRPATISNAVRVDSAAAAFNDANGNLDLEVATVLNASYRLNSEWAPMLRLGFVANDAPGAALDGSSVVNPVVGVTYVREMGSYRLALFGGTSIPIGAGGGNAPNLRAARAAVASSTARVADDAMFAVNYLTEIAGADFAYVGHGLTVQAAITLQPMFRVRGSDNAAATDAFRLNASAGLHLGYFMGTFFSLGADLRYQRWLTAPTTRDAGSGAHVAIAAAMMDAVTLAVGPRFHFGLGGQVRMHPGIAVMRGFDARAFDAPLITRETTAVQIDIPVTF